MREIVIKKNDSDQRLDKFLTKRFPSMPKSLLYKYIRTNHIKINGKRRDASSILSEGDTVKLFIDDCFFNERKNDTLAFLNAPATLDIVYEDENILLADKKPGLVVHADSTGTNDTLISRMLHYFYLKGIYDPLDENSFAPALVNRIDRNTGGIVIAAKNAEALRILNEKIKNREIKKYYLCLVFGSLKNREALLTGYLVKNESQNRVYIHKNKIDGSKTALTKYRVLDEKQGVSLLEVELITGRTHQIRAHLAHIGHPLLGDGKYGTNIQNKSVGIFRQALYSYRLETDFTQDSGILSYLSNRSFEVDDVWFINNVSSQKTIKLPVFKT